MKYKFRAECRTDVEALKTKLQNLGFFSLFVSQMHINGTNIPDCEVELEVNSIEANDVLEAMRSITDSHVMIQTFELAENYTGERDYKRR
jgi:hypothetical protein